MERYTVFCIDQCQMNGTTWIGYVTAKSIDEACDIGKKRCAQDWEYHDTDALRVLGVAEGEVKILKWED